MTKNSRSREASGKQLTETQRSTILRMYGLTIAMALTVPFYYIIAIFAPDVMDFVPSIVVQILMGLGLLIVFPATGIYGQILERRGVEQQTDERSKYGVDDQWERRNL